MTDVDAVDVIPPGTKVEVRTGFDASWARGFEVIDRTDAGYRLRRLSDNTELPVAFEETAVRSERKRGNDMWWY
jgi:hypothetical protein